jgi:hypothetical protein
MARERALRYDRSTMAHAYARLYAELGRRAPPPRPAALPAVPA